MRECRCPNEGQSPYIFQSNVQNHHKFGSLLLIVGEKSHFAQPNRIFFFFFLWEGAKEIDNGLSALPRHDSLCDLDTALYS